MTKFGSRSSGGPFVSPKQGGVQPAHHVPPNRAYDGVAAVPADLAKLGTQGGIPPSSPDTQQVPYPSNTGARATDAGGKPAKSDADLQQLSKGEAL